MSPEERELLNKAVSLAEENNKMLHSMKRSQRWSSIARAIYWIFIIGSAVGAFYLLQPYIDQLKDAYDGVSDTINNFRGSTQ
ncbi:hypothetical protein A3A03_03200 [Candidatus Nomurabacteria bacterium RIFCSPLOWO2_01_FULL_40_18]|uniref:Uncharacterized protein n=2 Tax=Candidatus Nomuraibacteriota TaxID=1752729 RepID=A0A1F6YCY1_9BACT|nr:MAG: hypothetical protein A3A03_03200 [Candidatus Nomurabacteria bacterium RIFCSPLOWO2_01_FULL_40_18]OGJ04253.1 MAG: hypothetical protein A3F97_02080 [Candidatus Nomurabacteria bacterium RIFCSPLOWO2_12_FULL_41_10]